MKEATTPMDFQEHDRAVRAQAITAFRRRLARRKLTATGGVLVTVLILGRALLNTEVEPQRASHSTVSGFAHNAPSTNVGLKANVLPTPDERPGALPPIEGELNDQELVALFPEGSCFIAEVNGKKKLVFSDAAVRAQFF